MELTEVGRLATRILDEVERAVVGKRDALELVLLGLLADGHVLLEDYPGLAKTLMARSFAQVDVARLLAHPVHARPDALRRHRLVDLQPARRPTSSSAPARSSRTCCSPTRSTAPRRRRRPRCSRRCRSGRSRPRARPARSTAVPRARDAEPDRVRRHLPAAGGAARPLPAADLRRLPVARGRVAGARAPGRAAQGRGRARAGRRPRRRCSRCSARSSRCTSPEPVGLYMVDLVAATRDAPSSRSARRRAASLALLKLSRGRAALDGPRLRRPRTTSSPSPCLRWRTG